MLFAHSSAPMVVLAVVEMQAVVETQVVVVVVVLAVVPLLMNVSVLYCTVLYVRKEGRKDRTERLYRTIVWNDRSGGGGGGCGCGCGYGDVGVTVRVFVSI